jgi:predicted tellurium resistance membrane protein TerC
MKAFLRIFTYWIDLYREIRIWYIFRKTAIENTKLLNEQHSLRVDWIGRIYGIINLPEEVQTAAGEIQQAYVLQQITKFGEVMAKIGLADVVYPEIEKVPNSTSYLIVLWPVFEDFNIWRILGNLIKTFALGFLVYIAVKAILNNWEQLSNFFITLVN